MLATFKNICYVHRDRYVGVMAITWLGRGGEVLQQVQSKLLQQ